MTRVWGRRTGADGTRTWEAFETDDSGYDDAPNFIWLQNVLLLNLNESPFYSDWGIQVQQTLATSVFPDYYTSLTQQRFSQYFTSCVITRVSSSSISYSVNITTSTGLQVSQKLSQAET